MEVDIEKIIAGIETLKRMREELKASSLAPEGAWIHKYKIFRSYPSGQQEWYEYAKWQSNYPIFPRNPKRISKANRYTRHQHIGRVDSSNGLGMDDRVVEAYEEWGNRKKLEEIEAALKEIEAKLGEAELILEAILEREPN